MEATAFGRLLEQVFLGDIINECVVTMDDDTATIRAVDLTNSLFVVVEARIGDVDWKEVGLGNIGLMAKFLAEGGEVTMHLDEKWATLKRKKHGQIKVQLLVPDQVPTLVVKTDAKDAVLEACPLSVPLDKELVERLTYYIGLSGGETVVFDVDDRGRITVHNSEEDASQFEFPFGKTAAKPSEAFAVEVYAKFLQRVFKVLDWDEKATTPVVYMGPEAPLVVIQGDTAFWAVTPIAGK